MILVLKIIYDGVPSNEMTVESVIYKLFVKISV